jgi:RNA polymerase sigma-70 factor (ECF subfamily)
MQALELHSVLHNLEEPYKEIFTLRVFAELKFNEIGKIFGKSENWARVTFFRSKEKIIGILEKEDFL